MTQGEARSPTGKGEETKRRILRAAAQLFVQKGYSATGIRDILAAADCSKGSFYFSFPSKKALGAAVVQFYQERLLTKFRVMAEGQDWREFSRRLMAFVIGNAEAGLHFGCPFAVLGMETAFQEPELARLSDDAMGQSVAIFTGAFLRSGLEADAAVLQAERAFACYEGYTLRYRLSGDPSVLHKLREALDEFAQPR